MNLGNSFSVLAAQYWGQKRTDRINGLGAILLKVDLTIGIIFFLFSAAIPRQLVSIFVSDPIIIERGVTYLAILKWTFIPYSISHMLMELMRNVETVAISFYMSVVSLVINVFFNYLLIFGSLGFPEMGVAGAAIATLIARCVEIAVLIFYVAVIDKKLRFFRSDILKWDRQLGRAFAKMALMVVPAGVGWAIATPVQTALIGKLSADAIAANSVTNTFYQLLKVVAQAMSAASAVIIGKTVGSGDFAKARSGARTIELIALGIGIVLGAILFTIRGPVLAFYKLTPEAEKLTGQMLLIMCFVMVGMAYEVPVLFGVIRGGGNAKFTSFINIAAMWFIVMPLAFLAVFVWHLDVIWVVMIIQSEQLIKCVPAFIRVRQYFCTGVKMIEKIDIIGLGALGTMYADFFSESIGKDNVRVLAGRERTERYRRDGVTFNGKKCDLNFCVSEEETKTSQLMVFAVKYGNLKTAMERFERFISRF